MHTEADVAIPPGATVWSIACAGARPSLERAGTEADCVLPSLQGRARTVGQVLLGYFEVPFNMDDPVHIAINPHGAGARSATR